MSKKFKEDDLAYSTWLKKYAKKDKDGNPIETETIEMHKRLVSEFIRIEKKYNHIKSDKLSEYGQKRNEHNFERILSYFKDFSLIVPQGRIMAGLGIFESYRSLSNCLVLPSPKDSYSSILYTDTMLVSAAKRGCGFGIDLSNLRPEDSPTNNAADTSTGVVPFMERYSNSTREVGQNSRRGACLLGIDSHHPDIFKFVSAKLDLSKVTGANISVKCRNDFFEKVKNNEDYVLKFKNIRKTIKAKKLWDFIIKQARDNAEPGIFIWDRIIDYDPASVYKKHEITLTNACGEQPMSEGDTCRLMVLNLYNFVKNKFTNEAYLDEDLLYKMAYEQIFLNDNVIDLEIEYIDRIISKVKSDPEPEDEKLIELKLWELVKEKAIKGRRIGCGLTGLGDLVAAMNLKYGSEESKLLIDRLMYIKTKAELDATIDLSILRGSFPDYSHNIEYTKDLGNNGFYRYLKETFPDQYNRMKKYGRRNINWSTISPTGTTSLMTRTTSGCEPLFLPFYIRRRKVNPNDKNSNITYVDQNGDSWEEYKVFHWGFEDWYKITQKSEVKLCDLKDFEIEEIFKQSPYYNSCANDLNWRDRVDIQAILQKYTTSAISSTINLPPETSYQDVSSLYMYAYEKGLKGVTVYREGSRSGVLISNKKKEDPNLEITYKDAPKRPKVLECDIYNTKALGRDWTVIVGTLKGKPYELFAFQQLESYEFPNEIKKGTLTRKYKNCYQLLGVRGEKEYVIDNIVKYMELDEQYQTRDVSKDLRHGIHPKFIVADIDKTTSISSFRKVVSKVLKHYLEESDLKEKCPECGTELIMQDGCKKCVCGYNACG